VRGNRIFSYPSLTPFLTTSPRSPIKQRRRTQNAQVAGASPAAGTNSRARGRRQQAGGAKVERSIIPAPSSLLPASVPVAQQKSSRLLTGGSKVQLLPGMPASLQWPNRRGIRLKTGELQVQRAAKRPSKFPRSGIHAQAKPTPAWRTNGTPTGQARRGPVLTGSCRPQGGMGCKSSAFRQFHYASAAQLRRAAGSYPAG
jgi:hypothetical protein